jgi:hypothetical protein
MSRGTSTYPQTHVRTPGHDDSRRQLSLLSRMSRDVPSERTSWVPGMSAPKIRARDKAGAGTLKSGPGSAATQRAIAIAYQRLVAAKETT